MLTEDSIRKYLALQIRKAKFELVEFIAKERADVIYSGLTVVCSLLLLFFGSLYASYFINSLLESDHLGFGIVFLFWLVISLTIFLLRKSIKKSLFNQYVDHNIPS